MRQFLIAALLATAFMVSASADEPVKPAAPAAPQPPAKIPPLDPEVEAKIKVLMEMVLDPKAADDKIDETVAAIMALEDLGEPAVPYMMAIALDPKNRLHQHMQNSLIKMGKAALAPLQAKWPEMTDETRWQFARFFEMHDKAFFADYAMKCLDLDTPPARGNNEGTRFRMEGWRYLLRTKDPRVKERYYKALKGGEDPKIRWQLLPHDQHVFDLNAENEILVELLKPDSWVAKGDGLAKNRGDNSPWWPDQRNRIIHLAQRRKVPNVGPILLAILQEKGKGQGYLLDWIVPALGELKTKEALPELELLAAVKPPSGKPDEKHPQANRNYKQVNELAAQAIKRIKDPK